MHGGSKTSSGFTLIELSIVMVVIGLITSSGLALMRVHMKGQNHRLTKENMHKAERALEAFLAVNGFYPCPASRLGTRGKETFGKALEPCISEKKKLFKHKRTETLPTTDTLVAEGRNKYRVRIGILPFRSLGLPDSDAVDGWGRLLQYAVTEKLTDSASFNQKGGAIDVIAEDGQSRLTPSSTAQYVVFSTGEDGKGGYSADGVFRGDPCPVDVLETENCNGDAVFMDAQSQLAQGQRRGEVVVSYDDYIAYKQYGVDLAGRGGLLYYYRRSCMAGFTEIEVKNHTASGVETLSKEASFTLNRDNESGERELCFSTLYSTTVTLVTHGDHGREVFVCPDGWTNIGYLEESHPSEDASYPVCAH